MIRNVSLEEISDGKLYGLQDMVRAGCNDCLGCFSCCQGMGASIILDPLDAHRLQVGLKQSFQQLLSGLVELQVVDGVILPNLKMVGEKEQCAFLNDQGRCSIHAWRPGICRIFPLGRCYEEDHRSFRYFLQIHECKKDNRTKVKVKKWIDVQEPETYDRYIARWHFFLKDLQLLMERRQQEEWQKEMCMKVLTEFYLKPFSEETGFYKQFEERVEGFEAVFSNRNI